MRKKQQQKNKTNKKLFTINSSDYELCEQTIDNHIRTVYRTVCGNLEICIHGYYIRSGLNKKEHSSDPWTISFSYILVVLIIFVLYLNSCHRISIAYHI